MGKLVEAELKELWGTALPIIDMNCLVYLQAMVSAVVCLGRFGRLELAGGALSIDFSNITGYSRSRCSAPSCSSYLPLSPSPFCGSTPGPSWWRWSRIPPSPPLPSPLPPLPTEPPHQRALPAAPPSLCQ